MKRDAARGGAHGIWRGGRERPGERGKSMHASKEAFSALLKSGREEGSPGTGLAVLGEASTFIVMLSMAGTRENPSDSGADPRLR